MSPLTNRIRLAGPRIVAVASLAVAGAATFLGTLGATPADAASNQYAVYTSVQNIDDNTECPNGGGNGVDCNIYNAKTEVFLNGGPASDFLPDGEYCFSVYAPNGKDLLSSDLASNRAFSVSNAQVTYGGTHATGLDSRELPATTTIGFFPFDDTPNPGGEYKFSLYKYESPVVHTGIECNEDYDIRKTDNFKVRGDEPTPTTTPPGEEQLDRELTVCKRVVDNGDGVDDGGTFNFLVEYTDVQIGVDLTNYESHPNPKCKTLTIPGEAGNVHVSELALRPAGWQDAPGYPKVQKGNNGAVHAGDSVTLLPEQSLVTFFNQNEPEEEETPPPPTQTPPPPTQEPPSVETTPPATQTPPPTQTPPATPPATPVIQEQEPEPTPEETVAGVLSTPIAPSAGTGLMEGSGHSMNTVLMLVGVIAASLGLGSLALDSRRK